jgi:hypothetical protein
MDGRCQEEVRRFVNKQTGADYADLVALAGIDGVLAGKTPAVPLDSAAAIALARFEAEVSTRGHGSTCAFVIGHTGCAGNPVSDEEHISDIGKAVETVRSWGLFESVVGLMAKPGEEEWDIYPISDTAAPAQAAGKQGWDAYALSGDAPADTAVAA